MDFQKQMLHPLKDYIAIGFDVDHCLVRNKMKEMFPLLCNVLFKILTKDRGYPKSLFEFGTLERNYIMNGLVIDLNTGNTIKLGENKLVLRAYFGFNRLTQEQIEKTYGIPPVFNCFNPEKILTDDYFCCLTFFECYFPLVFAKMLEHKKQIKPKITKQDIKDIMNDGFYAVSANYDHCSPEKYEPIEEFGHFYSSVLQNRERYLYKHDEMAEMLRMLKKQGKILFLISDSHYEFVASLMDYAYGADWQDLFDFIIVYGSKSGFFQREEKTFKKIDTTKDSRLGLETEILKLNTLYTGGCAKVLEDNIKNLAKERMQGDGRILFFGDNYYNDILTVKKLDGWDAVAIMEDLEDLDLGEDYDGRVWGNWQFEETLQGKIPTFWYSEMMAKANKCTSLVDNIEMMKFYHGKLAKNFSHSPLDDASDGT